MRPAAPQGTLLLEFTPTISLGNWPFLVAIGFLASVFAYAGYASGNTGPGLMIAGGVMCPAVLVWAVYGFIGFARGSVRAIWTNGVVLSRFGSQSLVPFSQVTRVEFGEVFTGPVRHPMLALEINGTTYRVETDVEKGAAAAVEIAAGAGVTVQNYQPPR